jgi:hypothetical protein
MRGMNGWKKILRTGWMIPALMVAMLWPAPARAASQAETRDYEVVEKDFDIKEWGRAEKAAAQFIGKWTNSENFA